MIQTVESAESFHRCSNCLLRNFRMRRLSSERDAILTQFRASVSPILIVAPNDNDARPFANERSGAGQSHSSGAADYDEAFAVEHHSRPTALKRASTSLKWKSRLQSWSSSTAV